VRVLINGRQADVGDAILDATLVPYASLYIGSAIDYTLFSQERVLSVVGTNKTPKQFGIDLISNVPGNLIGSSLDATLKSETEKAIILISTQ